jgi:hypothetical protein
LFSTAGGAVPRGRGLECRARVCILSKCAKDSTEVHAGECRQTYVTGCFGLVDCALQRFGSRVVVVGLTLRSSETRDLVCLRLAKTEASRCLRSSTEVHDGIVEPVLEAREFAEHCFVTDVEPGIVNGLEPVLDLIAGGNASHFVTG